MVQKILTQLDELAYRLQRRYMRAKLTRERVGRHYAFFHPRPTGKIVLEEYKRRTQTILVTGVFDVLHSEHKKLLRTAKNFGGRLIVAVESDQRVKFLKGPARPVNSLETRILNLQKLNLADEVMAIPDRFNSESARRRWLKQLRPAILAVSASTPHLPAKRRLMKQIGGRVVVVLPHNPKFSTTKMLKSKQ